MWLCIVLATLVIYKLLDYLIRIPKTPSPTGKKDYILITGCDSGFGNLFAKRLDSKGFHVFAACLTEEGKKELEDATSPKLRAFIMDVTNQESIQNGYKFVSSSLSEKQGLWALMNNAGIQGPCGPSEWMTPQHFQVVLDVNFLALVQVTNTFLPLLKKTKGRIVNTASIAGRFSLAGASPYVAAKYAVEGYSSALRMELKPFKIGVHLIEPGYFRTSMTNTESVQANLHRTWDPLPPEMKAEYGEEFLEGSKTLYFTYCRVNENFSKTWKQSARQQSLDVSSAALSLVLMADERSGPWLEWHQARTAEVYFNHGMKQFEAIYLNSSLLCSQAYHISSIAKKTMCDVIRSFASPRPERVVDAYEHAALGTFPRARYLVGYNAKFFFWPLTLLPEWFVDCVMLNMTKTPLPASVSNKKKNQ